MNQSEVRTISLEEAIDHLLEQATVVVAGIDQSGAISDSRRFPPSDANCHIRVHKANAAFFRNASSSIPYEVAEQSIAESEPVFLDAAWELCFRGILRPGAYKSAGALAGVADCFCITPYGREWLRTRPAFHIPVVPSEFARMFQVYHRRFGDNFYARAMEAYGCFRANLPIAACSMVGAASEAVFLHLASIKIGEEDALRKYRQSKGRDEIRKVLLRGLLDKLQQQFDQYYRLIGYWRDNASHGDAVLVDQNHAFVSLIGLVGLCQFAEDNYSALTQVAE